MYRTLLLASFAGLVAFGLGGAGLAWWGVAETRFQHQRTRLAHDVLADLLRLRADAYAIFGRIAQAVEQPHRVMDVREAEERERILAAVTRVRAGIAREVAFVGRQEDEAKELAILAEIEQTILFVFGEFRQAKALIRAGREAEAEALVDRTLAQIGGSGFHDLVDRAIAEEDAEVQAARTEADRVTRLVVTLAQLGAAIALAGAIAALTLLLRRLQRPVAELVAATEAARAGDYTRRVRIGTRGDEFAQVGERFNAMLEEVGRSRATLEAARRDLEQAVGERTAELAAANAALQQADAVRRRFLADVSHELRTPLTVIRGEAEIALRGAPRGPEAYQETLGRIAEQAAHTATLVDDLLLLARSAAGVSPTRRQAVALEPLVRVTVAQFAPIVAEAGVTLTAEVAAGEPTVEGDPNRLRQVLLILLDNAVRYSEAGGAIRLTLSPSPRGVVLRVADRGMGIDPDDLPHVFERFYRGTQAGHRSVEGSGLGLPVARAIVEQHGGTITIESTPGEGTTACVVLPVARRLRSVA